MAQYLIQAAYTPEAWAAQIANPQDRIQALKPVLDKLGGKFVQAWYAFGDYDIVGIMEAPDNVSAAAFSLAGSAGGALRSIKTTPLLSIAEGIEAMKKAANIGYQPPKKAAAGG
jgi:uncharacterized protein with GYD domain